MSLENCLPPPAPETGVETLTEGPKNQVNCSCHDVKTEHNDEVEELKKHAAQRDLEMTKLMEKCAGLESKLENVCKERDAAKREKETAVIKYAVSEKNILDLRHQVEFHEKKHNEALREVDLLQHKVQAANSEKGRICQMLDNKKYELKTALQELENNKADLNALKIKVKWTENNLRTEMNLHEGTKAELDKLNAKHNEVIEQISRLQTDENMQLLELGEESGDSSNLSPAKSEPGSHGSKSLLQQLERLQNKHKELVQENNSLSVKVQQLEHCRLEYEQHLSESRTLIDKQRQDFTQMQAKEAEIERLQLQLDNERHHGTVFAEQVEMLKKRNAELERDNLTCRDKEAELLYFTQQLTDKNVRLQSEFTSLETRIQQCKCEEASLKRAIKEHESTTKLMSCHLNDERSHFMKEIEDLRGETSKMKLLIDDLKQEIQFHVEENQVLKRKYELTLRESNREIQQCRKKCEDFKSDSRTSSSSSISANNSDGQNQGNMLVPEVELDEKMLLAHIIKLQHISTKKSEKIEFLEEHINTLVLELQKKCRLLNKYVHHKNKQ